jgi:hypothetical protein
MDTDASSEMERVLGTKPAKTSQDRGWGILEAHRWTHGALHQNTAPMAEHVVMRYFDTPRRIERGIGRTRLRSVTTNDTVTIIPAGLDADWDIYGGLEVVQPLYPAGAFAAHLRLRRQRRSSLSAGCRGEARR